jgi:WD40 repeat protein
MLSVNKLTTRPIRLLLLAGILLSTGTSFAEDKPETERAKPVLMAQLGHGHGVMCTVFSADGTQVLTGSYDKTARLWETATGKEIRRFEGHSATVLSAVFSPDGRQVLTGSGDGTARLWETATGKEIRPFKGHSGWVYSAVFSPDGTQVLTASQDKTARLCETATGKERVCTGWSGWN